jgi:hypothetical protein
MIGWRRISSIIYEIIEQDSIEEVALVSVWRMAVNEGWVRNGLSLEDFG